MVRRLRGSRLELVGGAQPTHQISVEQYCSDNNVVLYCCRSCQRRAR
jgi:hypothetical protein